MKGELCSAFGGLGFARGRRGVGAKPPYKQSLRSTIAAYSPFGTGVANNLR
jgi:hypothetical protein